MGRLGHECKPILQRFTVYITRPCSGCLPDICLRAALRYWLPARTFQALTIPSKQDMGYRRIEFRHTTKIAAVMALTGVITQYIPGRFWRLEHSRRPWCQALDQIGWLAIHLVWKHNHIANSRFTGLVAPGIHQNKLAGEQCWRHRVAGDEEDVDAEQC
jgi:hypothetical protein